MARLVVHSPDPDIAWANFTAAKFAELATSLNPVSTVEDAVNAKIRADRAYAVYVAAMERRHA